MPVRSDDIQTTGQPCSVSPEPASSVASGSPERFDPKILGGHLVEAEHLARYLVAAQFVAGRDVLDLGCGTGWGTALLARASSRRCVGMDVDEDIIADAAKTHPEVTEFIPGDMATLTVPASAFDVVVCMEAIEHVRDPERALDQIRRVLRPAGLLIISSPNPLVYPPGNPHHVHEYRPDELTESLGRRFKNVSTLRQHSFLASLIGDAAVTEVANRIDVLETDLYKTAEVRAGEQLYTLALASDGVLPEPRPTTVLASPLELRAWHKKLAAYETALARAAELEERVSELSERLLQAERASSRIVMLESENRQLAATLDEFIVFARTRVWQLILPLRLVVRMARKLDRVLRTETGPTA